MNPSPKSCSLGKFSKPKRRGNTTPTAQDTGSAPHNLHPPRAQGQPVRYCTLSIQTWQPQFTAARVHTTTPFAAGAPRPPRCRCLSPAVRGKRSAIQQRSAALPSTLPRGFGKGQGLHLPVQFHILFKTSVNPPLVFS